MPDDVRRSIAERANGAIAVDAQDGLFDQIIEEGDLEAVLEEREQRKVARGNAAKRFKEKDTEARAFINQLGLGEDATVRCGRFRIRVTRTPGRSVAFDTAPGTRMTITPLG